MRWLISIALAAAFAATIGGCTSQGFPITPRNTAEGSLRLVEVSPAADTRVTKDTIVVARLAFNIGVFGPGQYFLMAQAETKTQGRTTDGSFPSSGYPVLDQSTGEQTCSFPLVYVWDRRDVKRPITLWFLLNKRTGPGKSYAVAVTGPVDYPER